MDVMENILSRYEKAYQQGKWGVCEMILETMKKHGIIRNDKLDTINRMSGKKKLSVM